METVYAGQTNVVTLPVAAKASGSGIIADVDFYLIDLDGTNAGKWYRGSDQTWQAAASIAGAATHKDDGHWILALVTGVWEKGTTYLLYAKESGGLHIPVESKLECKGKAEKAFAAWMLGDWHDKSGSPGVYEILDPDDGTTVIAEIAPGASTPYKQVTIL